MQIAVRGQGEVMTQTFKTLGLGLVVAVLLVYLLMVVNFQSWLDPFIIMMAVPGALVGILWMLALTGTTINVESLMGAIMAVGVARLERDPARQLRQRHPRRGGLDRRSAARRGRARRGCAPC